MSEKPRKAGVTISYSGSINSQKLNERISAFSYTDCAEGESDTCEISAHNVDEMFFSSTPKRGDKFTAAITAENWDKEGDNRTLNCGTFCVDDKTYEGWPLSCKIGGTAIPEKQSFHTTQHSKTWEEIGLAGIAGEICGRSGLGLQFDAPSYFIKTMEQTEEVDSTFLKKLCDEYGLSMKVYSGRVVIYDPVKYEAKGPVRTIDIKEFAESWSYNCTMVGVYTGATIKYTDGDNEEELICQVGGGNRIFSISDKVDSLGEAKIKAAAKVNKENRSEETFSGTIRGDAKLCSGVNIELTGAQAIAGKYFIDKVTHNITADGVYTADLEMHKVQRAVS